MTGLNLTRGFVPEGDGRGRGARARVSPAEAAQPRRDEDCAPVCQSQTSRHAGGLGRRDVILKNDDPPGGRRGGGREGRRGRAAGKLHTLSGTANGVASHDAPPPAAAPDMHLGPAPPASLDARTSHAVNGRVEKYFEGAVQTCTSVRGEGWGPRGNEECMWCWLGPAREVLGLAQGRDARLDTLVDTPWFPFYTCNLDDSHTMASYLSMMDSFPLLPDMSMTVATRPQQSPTTEEQFNNFVPPITSNGGLSNYPNSFVGVLVLNPSQSQLLAWIGAASRDTLLESQNAAFMASRNIKKYAHCVILSPFLTFSLEAEMKGVKDAYLLLLERVTELANKSIIGSFSEPSLIPANPDIKPTLPTLLAKDYPEVLFWKKDQWDAHVNQRPSLHVEDIDADSASKDPGAACKALAFIMDRDGVVITRGKASAIRATCRHLWVELRKNNMAPPTWGQASHSASTFFRNAMYQSHPELRLCDDHWKLDYLARKDYPSWIRPSRKPQKTTNKNDGTGKFPSSTSTSNKRIHEEEVEKSRKKSKSDIPLSGPVAMNNPTVATTVPATHANMPHIIPDILPSSSMPESLTELSSPASPESLTEPSSAESVTEPSSPESVTEPSSPESLTEPSSPEPLTKPQLPSTTHPLPATSAKASVSSLLLHASTSPHAHVPTNSLQTHAAHALIAMSVSDTTMPHKPNPIKIINPLNMSVTGLGLTSARPPPAHPKLEVLAGSDPAVSMCAPAAKPAKKNYWYPDKNKNNSPFNLFALDYCRDHPKSYKEAVLAAHNALDPAARQRYLRLSIYNKANKLKPQTSQDQIQPYSAIYWTYGAPDLASSRSNSANLPNGIVSIIWPCPSLFSLGILVEQSDKKFEGNM
ncbi:hypothetical protein JB92DRAFT_3231670 [Gautieria morchelliformis]|nr:hypothetical protein JB92DRAFT_3231670 [Gautieria morchelliformis]